MSETRITFTDEGRRACFEAAEMASRARDDWLHEAVADLRRLRADDVITRDTYDNAMANLEQIAAYAEAETWKSLAHALLGVIAAGGRLTRYGKGALVGANPFGYIVSPRQGQSGEITWTTFHPGDGGTYLKEVLELIQDLNGSNRPGQ